MGEAQSEEMKRRERRGVGVGNLEEACSGNGKETGSN